MFDFTMREKRLRGLLTGGGRTRGIHVFTADHAVVIRHTFPHCVLTQ
jgi:hypothetical protein